VVIITSNNEKELPDAFLRRCFFHYIRFPDAETLAAIVRCISPTSRNASGRGADPVLRDPRDAGAEEEALDLSEVLDWLKLILAEDLSPEDLRATFCRGCRRAEKRPAPAFCMARC
jgi:MoxR-like ATPase